MRWMLLCLAAMWTVAGAQEPLNLAAAEWETLAGDWQWSEGVAETSVAPGESSGLKLKRPDLRDFELSFAIQSAEGLGGVAVRAHHQPAYQEAGKTLNLGTAGLYGMGVFLTDSSARLLVNDGAERRALASTDVDSEWVEVKLRAEGDSIQAWINGEPFADAVDETFLGGGIALCLSVPEGGKPGVAKFRDLKLVDLGRTGNWRTLFNGQDTTGWKEWGEEKWSVEDGMIIGRSGPKKSEGYLATEETWTSFRVRGSFKMLGEGNFGLFYHSTIKLREDDNYPVISGVQGEVEPGYPSSTGWLYESYKRGWLVEPPKNTLAAYVLQPEDWNEIEIRSEGKVVTTWVNGVRALHFDDPKPLLTEGSFALQLHAGGVDGIAWKEIHALD
ncbi:MAG: hypothetical protein RLZZ303_814 [Candidatus Hydrogenedentota bacterium]